MQFKYIDNVKKLFRQKYSLKIIKWILLPVLAILIYFQLRNEKGLGSQILDTTQYIVRHQLYYALLFPWLLVFINWSLEALKWMLLASKLEKITFYQSIQSVLTAQSLAFVTPQSLGEYAGRIWFLKLKQRTQAIGAIMLGRWSQTMTTLFFGIPGIFYVLFFKMHVSLNWTIALSIFYLLSWILILLAIFYKRRRLIHFLASILPEKWMVYISVLQTYRQSEVRLVLGLAFLRYITFTFQFYLILKILNVPLNDVTILSGISWMFLIKSIIPAVNIFTDLGVREIAIIYFFGDLPVSLASIVLGGVWLWIINILFPTFTGLLFINRLKILRT